MTPSNTRLYARGDSVRVTGLCDWWVPATVVRTTVVEDRGRLVDRVVVRVCCTDGEWRETMVGPGQVEVTGE